MWFQRGGSHSVAPHVQYSSFQEPMMRMIIRNPHAPHRRRGGDPTGLILGVY